MFQTFCYNYYIIVWLFYTRTNDKVTTKSTFFCVFLLSIISPNISHFQCFSIYLLWRFRLNDCFWFITAFVSYSKLPFNREKFFSKKFSSQIIFCGVIEIKQQLSGSYTTLDNDRKNDGNAEKPSLPFPFRKLFAFYHPTLSWLPQLVHRLNRAENQKHEICLFQIRLIRRLTRRALNKSWCSNFFTPKICWNIS